MPDTIVFASNVPSNLTDKQITDARMLSRQLRLDWAGVKNLSEIIDSTETPETLILLGDNWKEMTGVATKHMPGTRICPIWMGNSLINNTINYESLVQQNDILDRIAFLKQSKGMACIFGNCQTRPLRQLLAKSQSFNKDYYIIAMPLVQSVSRDIALNGFNEDYLKALDLFITMYISENNKYSPRVSTPYIKSILSTNCRTVVIPNSYFTAYFPQAYRKTNKPPKTTLKAPLGDELIENDYYAYESLTNSESIHPTTDDILTNLGKTIIEMIERETRCDITISDYILCNYRKRRLFYTRNHPTSELLEEIIRRLLDHLGYPRYGVDTTNVFNIDMRSEFIYPEVYEALGLEFDDGTYINKFVSTEPADEPLYMALFKMFEYPEQWEKSIRWVEKPLDKSIDFSANLAPTDNTKAVSKSLIMSNSTIHLSLDLLVLEDVNAGQSVVKIPECMCPSYAYSAIGQCIGGGGDGSIKITINSKGLITISKPIEKDTELVIDTTWLL